MYRVKIVHSYPLYHAGIAYFDNKPVLNKVPTDNLLANYVLPSVKNLNELNQYSRIKNLNSIQYRVPKVPYSMVKARVPIILSIPSFIQNF